MSNSDGAAVMVGLYAIVKEIVLLIIAAHFVMKFW